MKFKYKTAQEYVQVLKNADLLYYQEGDSGLTDRQYDEIKDEFVARFPDHEYVAQIGAAIVQPNFQVFPHTIKMGSQSKVNTPEELIDWHNKQQDKVDKKISYIVSEKMDGFSLSLKYVKGKLVQALTRGNGIEGEDVTENVKKMKKVCLQLKQPVTGYFRGEAIIFIEDFNEYFSEKANPRNAAAGTVRRIDGERCEHISFLSYDCLLEDKKFSTEIEKMKFIEACGLTTPNYEECESVEKVVEVWQGYEKGKREQSLYEMDGLVVTINDLKSQDMLGIINQKPRYSRAFKFSAQVGETTIEKVSWFVGRTGRITPVAQVKPVKLSGVTITNVTLHNLSEIKRLRIKQGSNVLIKRAGDVIPKIEEVVGNEGTELEIPSACPSCGKNTFEEEIFLWCKNSHCPAQNYETLLYWVKSLEIKGFGDELVYRLVEAGLVKEPADFYLLTKEQISGLDRQGEKSSAKVLEALHKKKELNLPQFIKGLGISSISEKTTEVIQSKFHSLEDMQKASEEELSLIHGIGSIVAKNFKQGLEDRKNIISNLLKHVTIKEYQPVEGGFLEGKSFCFTGVRDKELEAFITQNGGKIASGVSKTLTYLVAKDLEESSSKLVKAKELMVPVVTLESLKELIKKWET